MPTLRAFSEEEAGRAKVFLAAQVASMMGRKLEEDDWNRVYCKAKRIPYSGWSNLRIDVNHQGLGCEMKLLRVSDLNGKSIKSVCGQSLMHPAMTRSIRISDANVDADEVMKEVFVQYAELIEARKKQVQSAAPPGKPPDMRIGWLLWESSLTEFLYFEEKMHSPNADEYRAEWHATPARGARKESKSLWIYHKETGRKQYSVTTSAGIKLQPYFDVPLPSDENLYYFRVQGEPLDNDTVSLWVARSTANALEKRLGSLNCDAVSDAVAKLLDEDAIASAAMNAEDDLAVPVPISKTMYSRLLSACNAVSDEHRAQLLLQALAQAEKKADSEP